MHERKQHRSHPIITSFFTFIPCSNIFLRYGLASLPWRVKSFPCHYFLNIHVRFQASLGYLFFDWEILIALSILSAQADIKCSFFKYSAVPTSELCSKHPSSRDVPRGTKSTPMVILGSLLTKAAVVMVSRRIVPGCWINSAVSWPE